MVLPCARYFLRLNPNGRSTRPSDFRVRIGRTPKAYLGKGSSLRQRGALLLLNQLDVRGVDEAVVAHIRAVVCAVGMLTAVASHNAEIGPVDNAVAIHIAQEQTHRD